MSDETIKQTKTQLTNDLLMNAPPFSEVAEPIKAHLEGAPLLIAHNATFDKEMIDIEMERIGKQVAWPPMLCTTEQTMHLKGYRLSLTELHQHLMGQPFMGAHRAKNDVLALVQCCIELRKAEVI
jgi:DNA polymerase III alpha subunit (gram-positive type)